VPQDPPEDTDVLLHFFYLDLPLFINVSMTAWLSAHSHSGFDLTVGGHTRTQMLQFLCALPGDTVVATTWKRWRWSRAPAPEGSSCLLRFASQQIISIHLLSLFPAFTAPKSSVTHQTCPVEPILHRTAMPTLTGANKQGF